MTALVRLSNAVPESVWVMAALTVAGLATFALCELSARRSTGLDDDLEAETVRTGQLWDRQDRTDA